MGALVYCHFGTRPEDEGDWCTVYHWDNQPANILLTPDKTHSRIIAKLADFGCATSDEWTYQTKPLSLASNASAQTPGFDPPEFPRFLGKSDVWQLALVFVCVCNMFQEWPRSRINPRGRRWDRERPAGLYYSGEWSRELGECLVEEVGLRPGKMEL